MYKFVNWTYIVCLHQRGIISTKMLLVAFLLFFCLFSCSFSQSVTSGISVFKPDGKTMIFNIRINGDYIYNENITVNTSPLELDFDSQLGDVIEVIFMDGTSEYPGIYLLKVGFFTYFDSRTSTFFPVNQCTGDECTFKITPIGTFLNGVTASVFINGQATDISGYDGNGDSADIEINSTDFINVKLTGSSTGQFGMNFVTTQNGQITTVPWYNQNLVFQALIPTVYLSFPLDGISIYPSTALPVELISYPQQNTYDVRLRTSFFGSVVQTISIESNDDNAVFNLDNNVSDNPNYVLIATIGSGTDLSVSLNSISLIGIGAAVPASITFDGSIINSSYAAGSYVPIKLDSGDTAGSFMVQLVCGTLDPAINVIDSNTTPQDFLITSDFAGNSCTFSVVYPIAQTANSPTITVIRPNTQLKFIIVPSRLINIQGNFVVRIDSVGAQVPGPHSVTLQLNCNSVGLVQS